uniref:Uncharacterized protein n=1 Tax=Aegilops tauschii TaxID=37682 RepID=R7WEK2_AEGTA
MARHNFRGRLASFAASVLRSCIVPSFRWGVLHPLRHELDAGCAVRRRADADSADSLRPADQQPAIVDEWKVGYNLKEKVWGDDAIRRDEIAGGVNGLMNCDDGEGARRRASLMKEASRAAVEVGGSSDSDFTSFISYISRLNN